MEDADRAFEEAFPSCRELGREHLWFSQLASDEGDAVVLFQGDWCAKCGEWADGTDGEMVLWVRGRGRRPVVNVIDSL